MRKLVSLTCLAATVLTLAVAAADAAGPVQFCDDVYLTRGDQGTEQSHSCNNPTFKSHTRVYGYSESGGGGVGTGNAATCVGVLNSNGGEGGGFRYGPVCGSAGAQADTGAIAAGGYAWLHNHSTFPSRFRGNYYY